MHGLTTPDSPPGSPPGVQPHTAQTDRSLVTNLLSSLVAFDTTNPPRRIMADLGIVDFVRSVLEHAGCAVTVHDLGDGCIKVFGVCGTPRLLL